MSPIKVLIVDHHPIVQAGFASFLQSFPDLSLVGAVTSREEAVAFCEARPPDIVLMDISQPDLNELAAIQQMRHRDSRIKVLAFSTVSDGELVERAVQAG